jgi:hypothetical protein
LQAIKGIWEFKEWLSLFLAYNVPGGGRQLHATAALIPVICPSLPIEYEGEMGPRGGLEVPQKRDISCFGLEWDYVYSVPEPIA